jgi:Putative metallopeptidase
MSRIARSAVVAVAVAWLAIACTSANAQDFPWKGMSNPNVIVDYVEPRPPIDPKDKDYAKDMATYQRLVKIYERVKKRQVLEELSAFLSPLRLPKTLRVRTLQCNTVNAFYDPDEFTVKICYEWMDATEQMAPAKVSPEGFTRQEVLVGGFVGVMLHEMGHAISDVLNLPVLGREEDAADQVAAFIMLQFGKEVARRTLTGTAHLYRRDAEANAPTEDDFSDVHGTAAQRFYNTLCIAYGGDPNTFNDFVQRKILPKFRADTCAREYRQVLDAFRRLIGPYVDQELMEKVRGMQILRADDGRLDAPGGPQR